MSEISYFHNGVGGGDASAAPYDALLYDKLRGIVLTSQGAYVYGPDTTVAPNQPCNVYRSGQTAVVDAGVLLIFGVRVEIGSTLLPVPLNTSGLPRMDRVVVQVIWQATGTFSVNIILKAGIPDTVPAIPELIQRPYDIYEMPLARIYVPSGVGLLDKYIVDEREFIETTTDFNTYARTFSNANLLPNSEFIAKVGTSGSGGSVAQGYAPAFWTLASGTTTIVESGKFDQMERGSTCTLTCPVAGDGIYTTAKSIVASTYAVPATIRILIEVQKGEVAISFGGGAFKDQIIPVSNGPVEVIFRTDVSAIADIPIVIYNNISTETIFRLGQVTVSHGWVGAPYQANHEMMIFNMRGYFNYFYAIDHLSNTDIYIENTCVSEGVSACWMQLFGYDDSSSGAADLYARVIDYTDGAVQLGVEFGNLPNLGQNSNHGLVGVSFDTTLRKWVMRVTGKGSNAANLHAFWYIIGCCT